MSEGENLTRPRERGPGGDEVRFRAKVFGLRPRSELEAKPLDACDLGVSLLRGRKAFGAGPGVADFRGGAIEIGEDVVLRDRNARLRGGGARAGPRDPRARRASVEDREPQLNAGVPFEREIELVAGTGCR